MSRYLQGVRYRQIAAQHLQIVSGILRQHKITAQELPDATRSALVCDEPKLRQAAQLAFASGYLIIGLAVTDSAYSLQLKGPSSPRGLQVKARKTSYEAEMRCALKKNGTRPPGKQLVEALFAKLEL